MKRDVCIISLLIALSMVVAVSTSSAESTEARGVWLRPPSDLATIPTMLDQLTSAGFNMLFVETFYHGFTISPSSVVPIRPEYKDKDVLGMFVREGHKRGLQVHAWVEVFYWEVDTEKYPAFPKTTLFDAHPDWKLLLRDGTHTGFTESAHIFANPAHPDVRKLLLSYFKELITRYDVDGLNLDYVRYPAGGMDAGYDAFSRKKFQSEAGIDPLAIDRAKQPDKWNKWVEWRENQVTQLVKDVSRMVRETKPNIWLTADVFTGYYAKRYDDFHFQDWATWGRENLLDAIIPMAYGPTLDSIKADVQTVREKAGAATTLIPGLAIETRKKDSYSGALHPPIAEQIALMRQLGVAGHCIFCYQWILDSEEGFTAFVKGPYGIRALPPRKKVETLQTKGAE